MSWPILRLLKIRSAVWITFALLMFSVDQPLSAGGMAPPPEVMRWLQPQDWERDVEGPIVELGSEGQFDDMHIFAPCVALEKDQFRLWYGGSRGEVAKRVFRLGLATSNDGLSFTKYADNPVFEFGDGKHSILTPTLLRNSDGSVLRENGRLRMWFSATEFSGKGVHTLYETTSEDGINWTPPGKPQLSGIYAPTVLKVDDTYHLWYTDVSGEPWKFRHASSSDGTKWDVTKAPVMRIGQEWERGRLFYPTVVYTGEVFLMWYGSYWAEHDGKTAIGVAVSTDGITWHKNPHNPVFRPDPTRPWESHYTTSQSVMQLPDGSWRIWYASRKQPPFKNKYFAIGTAHWEGPGE